MAGEAWAPDCQASRKTRDERACSITLHIPLRCSMEDIITAVITGVASAGSVVGAAIFFFKRWVNTTDEAIKTLTSTVGTFRIELQAEIRRVSEAAHGRITAIERDTGEAFMSRRECALINDTRRETERRIEKTLEVIDVKMDRIIRKQHDTDDRHD
jgi:hypothetical protein